MLIHICKSLTATNSEFLQILLLFLIATPPATLTKGRDVVDLLDLN